MSLLETNDQLGVCDEVAEKESVADSTYRILASIGGVLAAALVDAYLHCIHCLNVLRSIREIMLFLPGRYCPLAVSKKTFCLGAVSTSCRARNG